MDLGRMDLVVVGTIYLDLHYILLGIYRLVYD